MALSWGKPKIWVKGLSGTDNKWREIPTPAENTTELQTEKGDKTEARVEGGDNEDVRYGKNNYALVMDIRKAIGRETPIENDEGVVNVEYSVALQPEDPAAPGFIIDRSEVSVEDSYTAADGAIWRITFDALKPTAGKKVKWGTISSSGEADSLTVSGTGGDFGD